MDNIALFCGHIVLVFVEKGRCCAVFRINCSCLHGKWTTLRYFVDTLFLFSWKMDDVALFCGQIVFLFFKASEAMTCFFLPWYFAWMVAHV